MPSSASAEHRVAGRTTAHKPCEPPDLRAFEVEEIGLSQLCGERDESLSRAVVRGWFERHLSAWKADASHGREDVPFCVPASVLGVSGAQWVFGTWEWLFPLPDGRYVLGATGARAAERADVMVRAARYAGLDIDSAWLLKGEPEGVAAERAPATSQAANAATL